MVTLKVAFSLPLAAWHCFLGKTGYVQNIYYKAMYLASAVNDKP